MFQGCLGARLGLGCSDGWVWVGPTQDCDLVCMVECCVVAMCCVVAGHSSAVHLVARWGACRALTKFPLRPGLRLKSCSGKVIRRTCGHGALLRS